MRPLVAHTNHAHVAQPTAGDGPDSGWLATQPYGDHSVWRGFFVVSWRCAACQPPQETLANVAQRSDEISGRDLILFGGGIVIKLDDEVIGAIGASGAPGAALDDTCARAGLDKIRDRLK